MTWENGTEYKIIIDDKPRRARPLSRRGALHYWVISSAAVNGTLVYTLFRDNEDYVYVRSATPKGANAGVVATEARKIREGLIAFADEYDPEVNP